VTQGAGEARGGDPHRLGRARRALREIAARLDDLLDSDELPPWAVAPLEDSQVDLISQWAAATWTEEATLLRQRQPDILSLTFPGVLKLLEELYPAHPGLARIRSHRRRSAGRRNSCASRRQQCHSPSSRSHHHSPPWPGHGKG
jgi:hypothetical protein